MPIVASVLALSLLGTLPGLAQDTDQSAPPPASNGGWRKFQPNDAANQPAEPPAPPADAQDQQGAPQGPPQGPFQAQPQAPPPAPRYVPTTVTLPAGTWVTIRLNERLSSDHNQTGDAFTGTLLEPIVANGLLIARRGETVSGIVSEAKKAGRVSGTSRLGLELTEIQLADGRQVQVKTTLMERRGNTSYGRDALAIGATTGAGAAIGAGVNGGVGAGVGAAAGLVASTIGVLLTRGRATVVGPETPMTFRTETPLVVDNSQQAFRYASQQDYNVRLSGGPAPRPGYGYGPGAYGPPAPYYGGYYAPAYGYPYPYAYGYPYWGPSFYFGYGGRWGRRW
ncbi:MAG TPA: hypothetical protein VME17_03910 [Bryobacteraceae bacterium]|nr:hypothetical protein [Bryobacteraceae bacterium]